MAGEEGDGRAVEFAGDQGIGGGAVGGVEADFCDRAQGIHLVETTAANDANFDRVHELMSTNEFRLIDYNRSGIPTSDSGDSTAPGPKDC